MNISAVLNLFSRVTKKKVSYSEYKYSEKIADCMIFHSIRNCLVQNSSGRYGNSLNKKSRPSVLICQLTHKLIFKIAFCWYGDILICILIFKVKLHVKNFVLYFRKFSQFPLITNCSMSYQSTRLLERVFKSVCSNPGNQICCYDCIKIFYFQYL